jgi:hypothetical protein
MTQDEILDALYKVVQENKHYTTWTVSTPHLVALVNLAIEHEREACAKIAEEESTRGLPEEEPKGKHLKTAIAQIVCGTVIAEAIRNRGQA